MAAAWVWGARAAAKNLTGALPRGPTAGFFYATSAIKMKSPRHSTPVSDPEIHTDWFQEGYRAGEVFARDEADYDELAAVYRAGTIPTGWDIYRAEILNRHLGVQDFDFQAYVRGFARACVRFYERI
jgi:hypothetical protein